MDASGWETLAKAGGGRFSDIYKVKKREEAEGENRIFALKIVDPDDVKPPHNIRNEVKILNDLKSARISQSVEVPNVIEVIDVIYKNMEYGLLFNYYELSLHDVLKSHIKTRTRFEPDGSMSKIRVNNISITYGAKLITGILKGLQWIHSQGIIHRDINPNNILLSNADLNTPVIIDFGIAYQGINNNGLEDSNKKFTDIATGIYKAPELLLSKRDYSNKVDMWAVGIIMSLIFSKDGCVIFDQDAMYSDLVLLSNILCTFGSPPKDWSDCKDLASFEAMNNTFFTKDPKPMEDVIPLLFSEPDALLNNRLLQIFRSFTSYETQKRLSATEALTLL